jgi:hypothetical protein
MIKPVDGRAGRDPVPVPLRTLAAASAVGLPAAPPATPRDRLHAAALHGGTGCVVSGAAALTALGFHTVRRAGQELVLVAADSGVQSWGRIHVRRTLRLPLARYREGVPLAPVPRAVADHVVRLRNPGQVQAVVAEAIQRRMCTVADLVAELEAGPRQGSKPFRDALRDVGYGAHSVPEARAGRLLRRAGIGSFEQNAEIHVRAADSWPTSCGVSFAQCSRSTARNTT